MKKGGPMSQTLAREARDMRERRDVDRLDSHLVSPVPPVSLGYPAGVFSCCAARLSSSQAHVRTIEVLACQYSFFAAW